MNTIRSGFKPPRTLHLLGFSCVLLCLATSPLQSQEKKEINVSGNWILMFTSPNGDKVESPLKLNQEGEKVTGVSSGLNGMQSPLEEGKIENDEISFVVNRMRNGQKVRAKYVGKLSGDAIKGKFESNFGGQPRTIDFEAIREKEPVGATGIWRWSFTRDDGEKMEFTLKLKEENGTLSGVSVSASGNENVISDAVSKDDEVSFKVVRERDDQKFTTRFLGKRDGDTIKGKIETDWTGEIKSYDWEAKRTKRRR